MGKTHLTVTFLIALLLTPRAHAASVDPGGVLRVGDAAEPTVTVVESSADRIVLSVEFDGLDTQAVGTPGGTFSLLSIPECGMTTDVGEPLLPVLRPLVQIPLGATPALQVLSVDEVETSLEQLGIAHLPYPVQPPVPKVHGALENAAFILDEDAYAWEGYYPEAPAALADEGQLRDRRYVGLEVYPLRYDAATGDVLWTRSVEIAIELPGADWPLTDEVAERYGNRHSDTFAQRHLVNPGEHRARLDLPIGYLIITADSFYEEVAELANFRRRQGYDVNVVRTSDIGASSTHSISAYVADAYATWPVPPTFLLLVGDTQHIPAFYGSHSYSATDVYYGTMDGANDLVPDVLIGRLPASSETDATRMVGKTVDYISFELGGGSDWIKRTTFMASVDYHWVSENTHNYCISSWLEPDGYDCERRYYHSYNATTNQVIGDINAGLSQLTYSGHGYTSGWSDGPPIDANQLPGLANAGALPVVQSYACYTGDYSSGECFGESWLRASNGAVAFWGSSTTSYWDEDDIMQRDTYDAWYGAGVTWLRGLLDEGLWGLYQAYGGGGMSRAYYEQFNLLGDPALDVWTSPPAAMDVSHPSTVPPGTVDVTLTVTGPGGGAIQDALVCLYDEGHLQRAGYTDSAGQVTIALLGNEPAGTEIEVHATAHDKVPYAAAFTVTTGGPGGDDDDDDVPGDDDDGAPGGHAPNGSGGEVDAACACRQDASPGLRPALLLLLALFGLSVRRSSRSV